MSNKKVKATLTGKMAFEMNLDGHPLVIDVDEDIGGENLGPRPKALLLSGLLGCTGLDVISMLNKMKIQLDDFNIEAEAEESKEHPIVYTKIHLIYTFKGKDLPEDKIKR